MFGPPLLLKLQLGSFLLRVQLLLRTETLPPGPPVRAFFSWVVPLGIPCPLWTPTSSWFGRKWWMVGRCGDEMFLATGLGPDRDIITYRKWETPNPCTCNTHVNGKGFGYFWIEVQVQIRFNIGTFRPLHFLTWSSLNETLWCVWS